MARADETESGEPVVITESDIANLIKSKGAVFAAIKSLVDYIGLSFDQIDTFYVAGGFGNYLNIQKAVAIGLLPDIPREKIKFIGNSSLTGARMALLSEEAFEKSVTISRSMTNIELTNHPAFHGRIRGRPVSAPHGPEAVSLGDLLRSRTPGRTTQRGRRPWTRSEIEQALEHCEFFKGLEPGTLGRSPASAGGDL